MHRGSSGASRVAGEPRQLSGPLVPPLVRVPFYPAAPVCLHVVSLPPHLRGFPPHRPPRCLPTHLPFPLNIQTPLPPQTHSLVPYCFRQASRAFPANFRIWLSLSLRPSPTLPHAHLCLALVRGLPRPPLPPCFAGEFPPLSRPPFPGGPSGGSFLRAVSGPRPVPPTTLPPAGLPRRPVLPSVAPPPAPPVRPAAAVMAGKRPRREKASRPSAAPNPPENQGELAPALLRAVAALVSREGGGTPSRVREPVYRSPRGRTHPHLRARGGSFRRRRPPHPPPVLQRQIVGPHLRAPSLPVFPPPPLPSPPAPSQQDSQQLSSPQQSTVPATSSPPTAPPVVPPPGAEPHPSVAPAEVPLVPPHSAHRLDDGPPPSEPPRRQHPLVPADPARPPRFPPPRASSPPLPPDAPDPEDDVKWWNVELWESPPPPGMTWGRDWDARNDFVVDILRWERRMAGVGECLSHVATVLEQLHEGLQGRNYVLRDPQLNEHQQGVVREAASQGLWRLLRLPLEPEHPDEDEGPGARAFRRVATAAEESPLQLVPALASLLRWIRLRFYVLNRV
ncbi:unnamed protein product [Closterium sp. Yama58-4]|nr:unnamed protein product [Closterium sp. Yama58-4]